MAFSSSSLSLSNGSVMSVGQNVYGCFGTGGNLNINNNWTDGIMQNITTIGPLTDAYSLNDALSIIITAPAIGPFIIPSKEYDYTDPVTGEKTFPVTPPTSTSQGIFTYESSDPTIASIDSTTGVITINSANKLGITIITITQAPWGSYTDTTFKETNFEVLPISPQLSNFSSIEKWLFS